MFRHLCHYNKKNLKNTNPFAKHFYAVRLKHCDLTTPLKAKVDRPATVVGRGVRIAAELFDAIVSSSAEKCPRH